MGFSERFTFRRAPEAKKLEQLSEPELVSLAKKGLEQELARLHIPEHPNRDRITEQNIAFDDIPEEEAVSGYFAHRANWFGPALREIVVDRKLPAYRKAKTLVHEGLHTLSANEKGGGMRKYLATLARNGYSGLDEGITEHYARFVTARAFPQFKDAEVQELAEKSYDAHSYEHLVMFVERTLKQIAERARGPNESEESAYERARDYLYTHYLKADHSSVISFLNLNASPGIGELLGAVQSPRGREAAKGYVSQQDSKESLAKVERLMHSFSRNRSSLHEREPLTLVIDKWYLSPKNYPGYPDRVDDAFVAEALYSHHYWSIAERLGNPNVLRDPLSVELSREEASELIVQSELIEEDMEILTKKYKNISYKTNHLFELNGLLRLLGHARDPGARDQWEAIIAATRANAATPEGAEAERAGTRALLDLKADLAVFVPRIGTPIFNQVFDYLEKRLAGDREARIELPKPRV